MMPKSERPIDKIPKIHEQQKQHEHRKQNTKAHFRRFGFHFSKLLWLLYPLRFLFKVELHPDSLTTEKYKTQISKRTVVYCLPRFSVIDTLLLHIALKKLGVLLPWSQPTTPKLRMATVLGLKQKRLFYSFNQSRELFASVVENVLQSSTENLSFQPVTVFWSRGAEKNERNFILKSLFPDDENATVWQKIAFFVLHSRRIRVCFGEMYHVSKLHLKQESTGEEISAENESELAKKFRRLLSIEFQRERRSAMGPALYDATTIENWILEDSEVQNLINSDEKPQSAAKKSLHYVDEISAKYNYITIKAMQLILDFIWNRIFKGVRVRNFDNIQEVSKQGQIIWMPCHRSHLDYLLLAFVLAEKGMVTPHIAAGVNLSFWPAGPIIRRCGVFFLRRSFSGNKLYTKIFTRYVDFLVANRFPIKFFPEGGRSRIGKLLSPKTGMLSMCVSSLLRRGAHNVYFMPVYFGYEKVIEEGAYARELSGAKKQKENLWQLLKSLRLLFSNYGHVDVSFGQPIHFAKYWETHFSSYPSGIPTDLKLVDANLDTRDVRMQAFIKALADSVNQGVNSAASASVTSIFAAIAQTFEKNTFTDAQVWEKAAEVHKCILVLKENLFPRLNSALDEYLHEEHEANDAQLSQLHTEQEVNKKSVLQNMEKWGILARTDSSPNGLWKSVKNFDTKISEKNASAELNLWWYRGTIFHLLAPFGIVAKVMLNEIDKQNVEGQHLYNSFEATRACWTDELFLDKTVSTEKLVQVVLHHFQKVGICQAIEGSDFVSVSPNARQYLKFFVDLCLPEFEMYGAVLRAAQELSETKRKFSKEECLKLGKQTLIESGSELNPNLIVVFGNRIFDGFLKGRSFEPVEAALFQLTASQFLTLSELFK